RSELPLSQVISFSVLFCICASSGTVPAEGNRPMQAASVSADFMDFSLAEFAVSFHYSRFRKWLRNFQSRVFAFDAPAMLTTMRWKILLTALAAAITVPAQEPSKLEFEVVSIKPGDPAAPGRTVHQSPGRYHSENLRLFELILSAWHL